MKRVTTYNTNDPIASTDLNTWQNRTAGVRPASASEYVGTAADGSDEVHAQLTAGYPTGSASLVDDTNDWRDRVLFVQSSSFASANDRPGGTADYGDWSATSTFAAGVGYTGTGAYADVSVNPATAVSVGNPPVAATGIGGNSYRVQVVVNAWLYARPTDGKLYLYNDSGAALNLWLQVKGTAALGV